jgi:hypothetical protein
VTHQPAISFSDSIHSPFNCAGVRTSNVRQESNINQYTTNNMSDKPKPRPQPQKPAQTPAPRPAAKAAAAKPAQVNFGTEKRASDHTNSTGPKKAK